MEAIFHVIDIIVAIIGPISDFFWEFPTNFEWYSSIPVLGEFSFSTFILVGSGIYFTFRLSAIQVGMFRKGLHILAHSRTRELGISPLAAFLLSSGIRVGPGNIMGVTGAIAAGGPGALFWMWDGRPINLDINHHMFMSVIWVNFLGYMFEVPSIVYMTLKSWEKGIDEKLNLMRSMLIGIGGVAFVGICSFISLYLNKITDEWFSVLAFLAIWIFVLIKLIREILAQRKNLTFGNKKDWTSIIFWFSIYAYCIGGLIKLEIIQAVPVYGIFALMLFIMTLLLALVDVKESDDFRK